MPLVSAADRIQHVWQRIVETEKGSHVLCVQEWGQRTTFCQKLRPLLPVVQDEVA